MEQYYVSCAWNYGKAADIILALFEKSVGTIVGSNTVLRLLHRQLPEILMIAPPQACRKPLILRPVLFLGVFSRSNYSSGTFFNREQYISYWSGQQIGMMPQTDITCIKKAEGKDQDSIVRARKEVEHIITLAREGPHRPIWEKKQAARAESHTILTDGYSIRIHGIFYD